MNQFPQNPKPNPVNRFRKLRDLTMGLLYIVIPILMIQAEKRGMINFGMTFIYVLSAICIIYGVFRIYRAFRPNPF